MEEEILFPGIMYDFYLMAKAGSPVTMPLCNDALLHPLDAFIYLVTAKQPIENLKSKIGNELLSPFTLFLCSWRKYFRASVSQIASQSCPVVKIYSVVHCPLEPELMEVHTII